MIAAVIPTRYHPPELAVLMDQLRAEEVLVIVLESEYFGHRIYRMWQHGTEVAKALGVDAIAILNDDITILPGTLGKMAQALADHGDAGVVYPDVQAPLFLGLPDGDAITSTQGTWGSGGMTGFCFMFRADLGIPFDESYGLWYGDDAFEEAVRRYGLLVCRVDGLPIFHIPGGSTSRDEWGPVIEADRSRWDELHA